ncbi:DUF423 domain-containing protein [Christiangramia sabulilitoris]|uniref:DUF423 domain-containing protein n=1 Tax=Christiangramia sabulilitoris TaxID=2583991 RepID=A0A550I022_9FLAO|nr:DUF423 domain-containing protein [Christiangramia sabulilitoris]TRO64321.1 DUF423 domain-containing protein [Christiangramia sabulilitoris]
MHRKFLISGAVFGLTAVILGAFAAHGLKEVISAESLKSFETGVRFQIYHAFLFLIIGGLKVLSFEKLNTIYYLLFTGVILFSVSIYLLSAGTILGMNFRAIAILTPLGGTLLILGWFLLLLKFIKLKTK